MRGLSLASVKVGTGLARCIFPDILAFYESEEGQREFAEWKAQQIEKANKVNAPQDAE